MTEYDWSKVEGEAVERLRSPKVAPVPEAVIKLAQKATDTGKGYRHKFASPDEAQAFAGFMRRAGDHVTGSLMGGSALRSMSVVIDPDSTTEKREFPLYDEDGKETGETETRTVRVPADPCVVAWKAGQRRGHKVA